ncbi:Brain-specific angiogenesis inhibitor 3, partial [Toxocara canis]
ELKFFRRRKCLPSGASCIGGDKEYRFCQDSICPYWDQWSPWSGCSVTCGIGTCERRRKCVKDDRAALPNIEEIIADAGGENDIKSWLLYSHKTI